MAGGMHGRGCMWQGAMHNRGHAWQGACVAGGHVRLGNMHGRGSMHSRSHAWQGACVVGHTWQERRPLQRTVCILLECILVST